MDSVFDYGALLAGLGFFLLGMQYVESSLQRLAGRPLKLFIRRNTTSPSRGIAIGAVTTAILQSSSLVTLMLLAFVGAGILNLGNAIGVVLGANLGTTMTGWLVATLGFKLEIDAVALPLIGIGALGTLFSDTENKPASTFRFLLGVGFLLFGLALMKNGVEQFAHSVDIGRLREYGPWLFLLTGVGLTAVIQSSSAAMLINLSALSAGLTTVPQAAAFAIGADVGTTFTVLLGSIRGKPAARQLAAAHLLFNVITAAAAFVLLPALLYLLQQPMGITDPLFTLVAFHTSFNLIGILLFAPFINHFAGFLQERIRIRATTVARFVNQLSPSVPEAALEALRLETTHLFYRVIDLNRTTLGIHASWHSPLPYRPVEQRLFERSASPADSYRMIKELEGEILGFTQGLQEQPLAPDEAAQLSQLQLSTRHAVQSAKGLKDVRHNLEDFAGSMNDSLHARHVRIQQRIRSMYERMESLWQLDRSDLQLAELAALARENANLHEEQNQDIYRNARREQLSDVEISTLLNVSRETYMSNASLIIALKEFLLPPRIAESTAELPGLA